MSLETKYFFPMARYAFLLVAIVAVCVAVAFGLKALSLRAPLPPPQKVYVDPQPLVEATKPFSTAAAPASRAPGDPFSKAVPPEEKIAARFPGSGAETLLPLLGTTPDYSNLADQLTNLIEAAEEGGDSPQSYVANAVDVLNAVDANLRIKTMNAFHEKRLRAIAQAAEDRERAIAQRQAGFVYSSGVAGIGLVAALLVSLILAVLAVERNTRLHP